MLSKVSCSSDGPQRLGEGAGQLQRGVGLFHGLVEPTWEGEGGGGAAAAQLGQVERGQRGEGGGEGTGKGGDWKPERGDGGVGAPNQGSP